MRAKHFAIGLGIALFLPLCVFFGLEAISPPPDTAAHRAALAALDQRLAAQPEERAAERSRLELRHHEDLERYYWQLFAVGYPVGVSALIVGAAVAAPSVGAGFMFGGLLLLMECCGGWPFLPPQLRFLSVVGVMAILIAIGTWKLGGGRGEPAAPVA